MPQSYSQTERINASPTQIKQWLDDWEHIKAWMGPSLVSIEIVSEHPQGEPICAGMRFRESRKMGKMTAKAMVSVDRHELDEHGVFHHDAVIDDGCNRMVCAYQYEPDGSTTKASWTISNAPNKWWTKLMAPLAGPMMIKMIKKCEHDHLSRLRDLIESTPDQEPQG